MSACIFCAIIARTAESSVVYEDEHVIAFMDLHPVTSGHLLVVPKRHASGLADLDPEDGGKVFTVGQRIACALRAGGLPVDGVNLFLADGIAAGQEVFHVHLHVIPRTRGDGFGLRAMPRSPSRFILDQTADIVRGRIRALQPSDSCPRRSSRSPHYRPDH